MSTSTLARPVSASPVSSSAKTEESPPDDGLTPVPDIFEVGVKAYSEKAINRVSQMVTQYCSSILHDLGMLPKTKQIGDKIRICQLGSYPMSCDSFRRVSLFVMSSLIKKVRKDMPFVTPATFGMHKGPTNATVAVLFVLLKNEESTKRYLNRYIKKSKELNLPFSVGLKTWVAGSAENKKLKESLTTMGVPDDETCLGVILTLGEVNSYLQSQYGETSINYLDDQGNTQVFSVDKNLSDQQEGSRERLLNSLKGVNNDIDYLAPHIYTYMPQVIQILNTLVRKHICFQNVNL